MATILDELIENVKMQIAQGKTHVAIDQDVLTEFYTDFATPVETPQVQAPQVEPVIPEQEKVVEPTLAVETPVVEVPKTEKKPEPVFEVREEPVKAPVAKTAAANSALANVSNLSLDELRLQGNSCSSCKLNVGEKRSQNTGLNAQARMMIITEPAGTGIEFISDPFHGDAGQLLIKMISAMNVNMDDVYLCMAHRCFGPGARETIGQTRPYLERQIELVNPEVIVIFGGAALNILLNEQSLVKCRGRWLEIGNVPAIATYPPGYLLKKAAAKKEAWNDLQQVMARLNL